MNADDYKFLRTSFDRIEILLGRIVEALEKKNKKTKLSEVNGSALKIADIWNEWRDPAFAEVKGLSPQSSRHKNAVARWKEKPDSEYWVRVIQRINDSSFCKHGTSDRPWRADFEFLVRPDNHYRILEGKFDDKTLTPKPKQVDVTHLLLEKLPD